MTAEDKPLFYPACFLETENAVRQVLGMPEIRIVDGNLHVVEREAGHDAV